MPVQEYLLKVGINYNRRYNGRRSANPISDFNIRTKRVRGSNQIRVTKIGKEVPIELKEGDLIEVFSERWLNEFGEPVEGSVFNLNVERGDQKLTMPYTVQTIDVQNEKHRIFFSKTPNQEQIKLQNLWFSN